MVGKASILAVLAAAVLAAPAAAQLSTQSSWPQVGHDPGLTRRTNVTASQTGTLATGFPAPLYGPGLINTAGFTEAGPPAVYIDGNLLSGTDAGPQQVDPTNHPEAQLVYVNAVDVPSPGAARALFTDSGPFPYTIGLSNATPAVTNNGLMYVSSSSGNVWLVPPSGIALPAFAGPPGTNTVGSPTLAPNGAIYVTAGNQPDAPVPATATLNYVDPQTGGWSVPIANANTPVALDSVQNAYVTSSGKLLSVNPAGRIRWSFDPPGPPQVLSPPMVYGNTAYVQGGSSSVPFLIAISTSTGRQLFATRIAGNFNPGDIAPALGPSGNVMALSNTTLTAINRTSGKQSWAFPLPTANFADEAPMVDGSGNTYIVATSLLGASVIGVSATGSLLWQTPTGFGATPGQPTGATIGVDGSVYVSATNGQIYAYTDPS